VTMIDEDFYPLFEALSYLMLINFNLESILLRQINGNVINIFCYLPTLNDFCKLVFHTDNIHFPLSLQI